MITGIENLSRTKQKAVLEFISSELNLNKDINIEEEDENIIVINNNRYFIINSYEENILIDNVNNDKFNAAFENLSEEQKSYVDMDRWIEDNGLSDFIEYLTHELNEIPSEDYLTFNGYHFYEL